MVCEKSSHLPVALSFIISPGGLRQLIRDEGKQMEWMGREILEALWFGGFKKRQVWASP
jgi:hypothetical protein